MGIPMFNPVPTTLTVTPTGGSATTVVGITSTDGPTPTGEVRSVKCDNRVYPVSAGLSGVDYAYSFTTYSFHALDIAAIPLKQGWVGVVVETYKGCSADSISASTPATKTVTINGANCTGFSPTGSQGNEPRQRVYNFALLLLSSAADADPVVIAYTGMPA